jgi:TRAP-type C4-dicarboxylate transport system permease small subunit
MKFLKTLEEHLEEYIMALLLVIIFFVMFVQIILRTLTFSLEWAEEFGRYLLVFSGFFSISYTIRKKNILKVDIITQTLPERIRKVLNLALMIISCVFFVYFWYATIDLVSKVKDTGQTMAALGWPTYFLYVGAFIGFALAGLRAAQSVFFQIKEFGTSEEDLYTKKVNEAKEEAGV